jgi:hypothetical protein
MIGGLKVRALTDCQVAGVKMKRGGEFTLPALDANYAMKRQRVELVAPEMQKQTTFKPTKI